MTTSESKLKSETKSGDPRPLESELGQVVSLIQDLHESIKGIDTRLTDMEREAGTLPATKATEEAIEARVKLEPEPQVDETLQERRLDPRYQKIVTEILGDQFEAWEEYEGCLPSHFRFVIKVPSELSSVPKETHTRSGCEHEKGKCELPPDLRSKTLTYAVGENGVREWCSLVRLNLNKFYSKNALPSPFSTSG